jgi:hypothetical protein
LFVKALESISEAPARRAISRAGASDTFYTDAERARLGQVFAAVLAAADLRSRAIIRALHASFLRRIARSQTPLQESRKRLVEEAVSPSPPERAVAAFVRLIPTLGVDPERFGEDLRRRAFTLAAATDRQLLDRVQGLIADRIRTGEGFSTAPADIQDLLDQAGVTPRNPQYAQMVFRTNVRDAQIQAAQEELQDPDLIDSFPVWEYIHATGSTAPPNRPEHAERHGKLYPSSVPFVQVRGTDINDVANCRCNFRPIDKFTWSKMKAAGAKIADGYADVPSIDELRSRRAVPIRPTVEPPPEPQFPTRTQLPPPRPMPAVANITTPAAPAASSLRQLAGGVQALTYQQIGPAVDAILGPLSPADAIAAAREFGISTAKSRAEAIRLATARLTDLKASIDRTAEIDRPAPAQGQTQLPFALRQPSGQDAVRVQIIDAGETVRLVTFNGQEHTIRRGETFFGWTWGELRALGPGLHRLGEK